MDKEQILDIIKDALQRLDSKYYSDSAVDLIYHTGLVESRYKYLMQLGNPVARGFFQMEGATAVDICKNFLAHRPKLMGEIEKICYFNYFVLAKADIKELEFLLVTIKNSLFKGEYVETCYNVTLKIQEKFKELNN